jgi:hypothetical protein
MEDEVLKNILIAFGAGLGGLMCCICCFLYWITQERRKEAEQYRRPGLPYLPVIEVGVDRTGNA